MLDIETWLSPTGIENNEDHYDVEVPPYPYVLYLIRQNVRGADNYNCISERSITLELYSEVIDSISESKIEELLKDLGVEYEKNRQWIGGECDYYQTTYDFDLIEKLQ